MKFNYSKLLGRIRECGLTQAEIAQFIGISCATMSQKLNNKAFFYQPEIEKMCEALDIEDRDVGAYFFTQKVEKNSTNEEAFVEE